MTPEALAQLWFVILGILLVGYAILDGFDLGVGILHPFLAREDRERRLSLNSIGPLWDGNEVWLVTFADRLRRRPLGLLHRDGPPPLLPDLPRRVD